MHDPVNADLNRYLAEQDKADALSEAIDEKVDQMMADPKTVKDIIEEMMCNDSIDLPGDISALVTVHADDKAAQLVYFFDELMKTVRLEAQRLAPDILEGEDKQAAYDKAEAEAISKEDYLPY